MDIKTASGGVIRAKTRRGHERFDPLTVGDLGDLQSSVPGEDQRFVTIFQLHQWSQTPKGADEVVLASMRRRDPNATIKDVAKVGSVLDRVQLARLIMSESLTNGEEPEEDEADNAPKAEGTETG